MDGAIPSLPFAFVFFPGSKMYLIASHDAFFVSCAPREKFTSDLDCFSHSVVNHGHALATRHRRHRIASFLENIYNSDTSSFQYLKATCGFVLFLVKP